MKKLLIYLPILLLFSCSSDDKVPDSYVPATNEIQKKMVGTWYKEKELVYNSDGTIKSAIDYGNQPCYRMSTYNFFEDKTYLAQIYDFNNDSQLCEADVNINGTWRLSSSNELVISEKKSAGKITEKTIVEAVTVDELVIVTVNISTNTVTSSTSYYKM